MDPSNDGLRDLVRKFRVTWETRSEMAPRGRSIGPVGYLVELTAVPDDTEHETGPCLECEEALAKLVDAVAPSEVRHVERGGKQIGSAHDGRPEVTATVMCFIATVAAPIGRLTPRSTPGSRTSLDVCAVSGPRNDTGATTPARGRDEVLLAIRGHAIHLHGMTFTERI